MGGTSSTHVRYEIYIQYFGWKTGREEPLGTSRRRWDGNIRMNLMEIG
jgi:hypothetical protein